MLLLEVILVEMLKRKGLISRMLVKAVSLPLKLQGDELEVFCAARAFLKAPCQTEQAFDGLSERLLHWAQGVVKQAGTALTQGG